MDINALANSAECLNDNTGRLINGVGTFNNTSGGSTVVTTTTTNNNNKNNNGTGKPTITVTLPPGFQFNSATPVTQNPYDLISSLLPFTSADACDFFLFLGLAQKTCYVMAEHLKLLEICIYGLTTIQLKAVSGFPHFHHGLPEQVLLHIQMVMYTSRQA